MSIHIMKYAPFLVLGLLLSDPAAAIFKTSLSISNQSPLEEIGAEPFRTYPENFGHETGRVGIPVKKDTRGKIYFQGRSHESVEGKVTLLDEAKHAICTISIQVWDDDSATPTSSAITEVIETQNKNRSCKVTKKTAHKPAVTVK